MDAITTQTSESRTLTRAEQRRRLAASEQCAYRLIAKVRRPDLVPFASPKIQAAIGLIEACRSARQRAR